MQLLPMLFFLLLCLSLLVLIAAYVVVTYNNLTQMRERLKSLQARVNATRQRRQGVGKSINRAVGVATGHEQRVAAHGSRRGIRGKAGTITVTDTNNGWPAASAIHNASEGLQADIQSADLQLAVERELHDAAEAYNARLKSFPANLVARVNLEHTPWRIRKTARVPPSRRNGSSRTTNRQRTTLSRSKTFTSRTLRSSGKGGPSHG